MNNIQNRDQKTSIQRQSFGIEIEGTGMSRRDCAEVLAEVFGTRPVYAGGNYDKWEIPDRNWEDWTVMSDGSVTDDPESCEIVSPIMSYEEILRVIPEIMSALTEAGYYADSSCGIHIHVSDPLWSDTPESLGTLLRIGVGRENLLYESLGITYEREQEWAIKTNENVAEAIADCKDMDSVWEAWYVRENSKDHWSCSDWDEHYNPTRYHGINLHSLHCNKGVEFRYFNGTTDPSRIFAYIQLCGALHSFSLNCAGEPIKFYRERELNYTQSQKKTLFGGFLRKRLGMAGAEFSQTRKILLEAFA